MEKRPNIVWLTADHQVFANHYNYQNEYKNGLNTYEYLAKAGRTYGQAYTVCPLCTPSRASMLTGRYPHQHGMELNPAKDEYSPLEKDTRLDFDRPDELFAWALKKSGYRIVQMGKWYGGSKTAADFGWEGFSLPWYGAPLRTEEYREYLQRNHLQNPKVKILWSADEPETLGQIFDLTEPHEMAFGPHHAAGHLLTPKETHEAYFISDLACRWLEEYAGSKNEEPFMMKVDVWGPHHPYDVAEPFYGRVDPEKLDRHPSFSERYENKPSNYNYSKQFWSCMDGMDWTSMSHVLARSYEHAMMVDDALGRVVEKLENLSMAENTLIILTADHGDIVSAHGGLFNKETLMVEETMKIPMVMRWDGHIEQGVICNDLVSNLDLPATVLAAAGVKPEYEMDGMNLLGGPPREHLMCETFGCYKREFPQRMLRWGNYKYIAHNHDLDEFYDLIKDPFELHNLIHEKSCTVQLEEAKNRLRDTVKQYGDDFVVI